MKSKQFWQEDIVLSKFKVCRERFYVSILFLVFISFISLVLLFLGLILYKGLKVVSWEFLTDIPTIDLTGGGIFPAIMGTILITLVSGIVSIVLGVMAGIYLAEYAKKGRLRHWIWLAVKNLAGVPSIIYGLFGMVLFIETLSMHKSILTAGLTLGNLALPVVITSTVEAIRSVPFISRQASLGLGASHWQTLYKIILPSAFPGILTGIMLSLTRCIGETAPILFTGVAYYIAQPTYSLSSSFMALPYHIFTLTTQNSMEEEATRAAYGSSLVLVLLVVLLSMVTLILRSRMRKDRSL
jgi:phosphate transport system permease protein